MRFTTINSVLTITNKNDISSINSDGGVGIPDLGISAYIEENLFSRHITLSITPDCETHEGFDIWLDLDIYQAELLSIKLMNLVNDRKMFLGNKMNEK